MRLVVTLNDLSLLKRIDQLPAMDGIPAITGDGTLYVNGVARALPATGASFWVKNGTNVTLDAQHPQYWNDITIARSDLQTWSTLGVKDANGAIELTVNAPKGSTMPVNLLQMRDIEQCNIHIPPVAGSINGVPIDLGTYKKDHFEQIIHKLLPQQAFYDRLNIVGIPVNEYGGADGELSIQILKEAVAYQNSLSPLTQIIINETTSYTGATGQMALIASTGPFAGYATGPRPNEIRASEVHIQSWGGESNRVGAAGSELLSGTTAVTDPNVQYPGGNVNVNLGQLLYGTLFNQNVRGQPFAPIGFFVAGYALNTDRGITWAK